MALLAVDVVITVNRKRWSFSVVQQHSRRWGVCVFVCISIFKYITSSCWTTCQVHSTSAAAKAPNVRVHTTRDRYRQSCCSTVDVVGPAAHTNDVLCGLGVPCYPRGSILARVSYAKYSNWVPGIALIHADIHNTHWLGISDAQFIDIYVNFSRQLITRMQKCDTLVLYYGKVFEINSTKLDTLESVENIKKK